MFRVDILCAETVGQSNGGANFTGTTLDLPAVLREGVAHFQSTDMASFSLLLVIRTDDREQTKNN